MRSPCKAAPHVGIPASPPGWNLEGWEENLQVKTKNWECVCEVCQEPTGWNMVLFRIFLKIQVYLQSKAPNKHTYKYWLVNSNKNFILLLSIFKLPIVWIEHQDHLLFLLLFHSADEKAGMPQVSWSFPNPHPVLDSIHNIKFLS